MFLFVDGDHEMAQKRGFEKSGQLIVIGGKTGSGKTHLLREISILGEQVLDLETLANHRGSVFGGFGQKPQPSHEEFQQILSQQWLNFNFSERIWIEHKSKSIGKVGIPGELWNQMSTAPLIKLKIPKIIRIKKILDEYGCFDRKLAEIAIIRLEKRLGWQNSKLAIEFLKNNDLEKTVDILLTYYDDIYDFQLSNRKGQLIEIESNTSDSKMNATKILERMKTITLDAV